jgi:phosphate-selective porin OprO/OprP
MKRKQLRKLLVGSLGVLASASFHNPAQAQSSDALLNKLVEKGILATKEGHALRDRLCESNYFYSPRKLWPVPLPLLWVVLLAVGCLSWGPSTGLAQSDGAAASRPDSERIEKLEKAVQQLQRQNEELMQVIKELKGNAPVAPAPAQTTSPTPTPKPAEAAKADAKPKSGADLRLFWKEGLQFEAGDGKTFKGKFGGSIQYDMAAFDQDAATESVVGDAAAATEFRRVRLYTSGEINAGIPVIYKSQIDFAGPSLRFADVYLGLNHVPYVGTLQLGQMYEPFSIEQNTSDNYIPLLERSLPIEAFSPARNVGGLFRNTLFNERMTWAAGIFVDDKNDKGDGDSFDSNTHFIGRLTGLPWYDEASGGRRYWHLGVGGGLIDPEDNTVRFRSRPEAHLAPNYVDTGNFAATDVYLSNVESVLTYGPLSLQGEYFRTWADTTRGLNLSFDGFYVYGSWFLTGEHRPYKKTEGIIDRVKPLKSFSLGKDGWGALELAARYSRLDLNDQDIAGGRLADYTGGLNWYFNPNARLMLNYIYSDLDRKRIEGHAHSFQTRFQVDF